MQLLLESTLNQARAYFKKATPPVNFIPKEDREKKGDDIGVDTKSDYVLYLKEYIDFKLIETLCKQPVKIENISKKGGNNLDIIYLMFYLYKVENLKSFVIEENQEFYERISDDTEIKNVDEFIDNDFKKFTINKGFIEKYSKNDYRNSIEYYISHIIINNNFIALLPLGNPAQLTPKTLGKWRRANSENAGEEYTISEYLFDWLISWLPYRVESNKWLKNFPSNIRQSIKRDYMDTFISYVRSLKKLPYSKQEEIWNTYFISHEGDRGIIRRFNNAKDFMDDFKNRIKNAGKGLGEFLLRMEKLGRQVSTVYSKDSLYILDVKSYIASHKLAADSTSWCIASYENYWNQYVTEQNKQYFIMDFDKTDDRSRIGITIQPDGHSYTAHTKTDRYIDERDVIQHMKDEYGIENVMDYLKPISDEEYRIIRETKEFKNNIYNKVTEMIDILRIKGRIKGSELETQFYELINSEYFEHLDSQVDDLGSMFLTLQDYDNYEKLVNKGLDTVSTSKIIHLINKNQIDLLFKVVDKIDFDRSNSFDSIFTAIYPLGLETYFKLFETIKKLYYEVGGNSIYSLHGVLDHLLKDGDNGLELLKMHIDKISDKEAKILINGYSSDSGQTLLDSVIGIHIKEKNVKKETEFPQETVDYILEKDGETISVEVLHFAYKEKFIESIVREDTRMYKKLLGYLIDKRIINVVDLKYLEEKLGDIKYLGEGKSLNNLYNQIIGNEDRCREVFDYLIEKEVPLNKFESENYWGSQAIESIVKIVRLYDGDRLKEVLNYIKNDNNSRRLSLELFLKYIGSGTTKDYLDTMLGDSGDASGVVDQQIFNKISEILKEKRTEETTKKVEEIVSIHRAEPRYKLIGSTSLSLVNDKYPEFYQIRAIKDGRHMVRVIKTYNQNLIRDAFTEENIQSYKEDIEGQRDLLTYLEKDNIETLFKFGIDFNKEKLEYLIDNVEDKKNYNIHEKVKSLMDSDPDKYSEIINERFDNYDNINNFLTYIIDMGNINSVKYFMEDWFLEKDINMWGAYAQRRSYYNSGMEHKTLISNLVLSTVEIFKYIIEDCEYLSKLNDFLDKSNTEFLDSKEDTDRDRDYIYKDIISANRWSYSKKHPMTIGKLQILNSIIDKKADYDFIDIKLDSAQYITQVDSNEATEYLITSIKDGRGSVGLDPTHLMKIVASAPFGRYRSQKWFMPQTDIMQKLYDLGANVRTTYDYYKRSRDLSPGSREFLKDKLKDIAKAEKLAAKNRTNEVFSFAEFKYSNI